MTYFGVPELPADHDDDPGPHRSPNVPTISSRAYHGLIGDYVRALAPGTEADPVGILLTSLSFLGCRMGPGIYVPVTGTRHPPRIWPLTVGKTSTGRKGTTAAVAINPFSAITAFSALPRRASGLSSGEGLIQSFMDDDDGNQPPRELFIIESEYESVLQRGRKDGNSLTSILRQAWETGDLSTLTVNKREVTDTHLVVVGHITPEALRRYMSGQDVTNGMVNRFVPAITERPRLVSPFDVEDVDVTDLAGELLRRAAEPTHRGRWQLTSSSKDRYRQWYADFEHYRERQHERVAMVLGRGPVQVVRLALIYAVLDESDVIGLPHLDAAIALWRYASMSAQRLYGVGQAGLDAEALNVIKKETYEIRREDLRIKLGKPSADELDQAIHFLIAADLIEQRQEHTGKQGRPATYYRAKAEKTEKTVNPRTETAA